MNWEEETFWAERIVGCREHEGTHNTHSKNSSYSEFDFDIENFVGKKSKASGQLVSSLAEYLAKEMELHSIRWRSYIISEEWLTDLCFYLFIYLFIAS